MEMRPDKFGTLFDADNTEWHWWASYGEDFFNMSPSLYRNLNGFLSEVRDLVETNRPLLVYESPQRARANTILCMKINELMFQGEEKEYLDRVVADRAMNAPIPLVFLPNELACLLVALES